jgi:glucose uptake protein
MFVPQTFTVALLMVIASTICWGSWANTFKGTRNYRFELFYWDYALGIFLVSLLLAFTLGSLHGDDTSFLANVRSADTTNVIYAVIGGVIFNIANLLLVAGIDMAGLAIAFPVSIGIALVVGVLMSYIQQPKGNFALLAIGVVCAIAAVIMDGKAHAALQTNATRASSKSITVCVVSGLLMGAFAPFVARAMSTGHALSSYSIAVFFTFGALVSCFVFNVYLMKKPLVGPPVDFVQFFRASPRNHVLGLLGGSVWGLGTVLNFVAASFTGVAISYAIGQSAPMVAALWGVLVWKEFGGAGLKAKTYLGLTFTFFVLAILLVSQAYRAGA